MQPSTKSFLMLVAMLLLGAVAGAAVMAGFRGRPPGPPPPDRRPGGFVTNIEQTIQPRDAAQRAAIRPILEATDERNREVVEISRRAMRGNLDSMAIELAPLLDQAQRDRLAELTRRLDARPPRPAP